MTPTGSLAVKLAVAVSILSGIPAAARAQPVASARPVSGFLSVNAGLSMPTTTNFEAAAVDTDGVDRDEFKADYRVNQGPSFDIGGGVLLRERIILGLALSHFSNPAPGNASIIFTHPLYHPTISATASTGNLDRSETGVHIQLGYRIPLRGRLEMSVFGGPSHFTVAQGLVADLGISEQQNPSSRLWSVAINDVETERQTGSAWGYHVGTDVSVPVAPNISVGLLARYSKARVSVEDPVLSLIRDRSVSTSLNAGGLQMMGGIRVRF